MHFMDMQFMNDPSMSFFGPPYQDFLDYNTMLSQDLMAPTFPDFDFSMFSIGEYPSFVDPMTFDNPFHQDHMVFGNSFQPDSMTFGNPFPVMPMVDMFGNQHFVNPMEVDIMSGLPAGSLSPLPSPASETSFTGSEPCKSYDQMRLDKGNEIEAMRDTAVRHYRDAKDSGNIEDMLKWEAEANKQQGRLYDHWGTPTYGLSPKAPGID